MKRRNRWPRFLDMETPLEALQPDYRRWQAVQIGMTREEVSALLGPPQPDSSHGPKETYSTYGHLQFPLMPHPRAYVFILGFDEKGCVFTKSDPFGGVFSTDGRPSKPKIFTPPEGAIFSHFPRIVDMRWYPASGKYPIVYEIEVGHGLEMDGPFSSQVIETECPIPYYVASCFGGDQPGRFRVRGRNKIGIGEWSEYRHFDFTPRPWRIVEREQEGHME
ncbi:MAG: outer membrane protein assembly factor BamE [Gemmataceae bacterium]|nr:outer membrane protein assembly factor BamE [Gemmataceae bacterium]MCI0740645.1 outer membrane protein assembly factor BamE [Gemmataceae bacterium]